MTLADSLRSVIAAKDSVIALAALRPVNVNLPPLHVTVGMSRDFVDYLVNPGIALLAAIVGAFVGGWQARRGGLTAIRAEFALHRGAAVERLRRRIDRNLIRTMTVSIAARERDPRAPSEPATISELRMIWESYDRLAEHLGNLGERPLQDRVDIFFAEVRKAADVMEVLEAQDGVLALEQARDPSAIVPGQERGRLAHKRAELLANLSRLELEAKGIWLEIYYLGQPERRTADDEETERRLAAEVDPRPPLGRSEPLSERPSGP